MPTPCHSFSFQQPPRSFQPWLLWADVWDPLEVLSFGTLFYNAVWHWGLDGEDHECAALRVQEGAGFLPLLYLQRHSNRATCKPDRPSSLNIMTAPGG